MILLTGCMSVGRKNTSLAAVYFVMVILSAVLLVACCVLLRKKDYWFLLLFCSVLIVNAGYLALSLSVTLEGALAANRIAYFGSAMLPLSMLMTVLNLTGVQYKKWVPVLLIFISAAAFLLAATPGYLNIYYSDVSLGFANGVAVLQKTYGPLHDLYFIYFVSYFALMVAATLSAATKKKMDSNFQSIILVCAVFVNIGVWLFGQLVEIPFEFLSVSYIISELFLLALCLMIQENDKQLAEARRKENDARRSLAQAQNPSAEQCRAFEKGLPTLTQTEQAIYRCYVDGMSTKEILQQMNIKENTLKYHNRNIYSKLGVSSRKQLLAVQELLGSKE